MDMPELHTYNKTPKSENGIVQNAQEQQYHCCYWMLWGTMATIVVLIAILTFITLTVASTDIQSSKDFQVACPELPDFEYGSTTTTPWLVHRGIGSTVNYLCDQGYFLVGTATRHCVYRYTSNALNAVDFGIWNGSAPSCRVQCPPLGPMENGSVILSSMDIAPVIATYSCQNGYLLIGPKQRECGSEEIGQWSGIVPACEIGSLIDCNQTNCRLTSVDCRYHQGYCSISCNSSMNFACHQASFDCPLNGSGCYINCASEYEYECLETSTLCEESGDCIVDCLGRYSCQDSSVSCSRNGQSKMNCAGQQACQNSQFTCSEGKSSLVNCSGSDSCDSATLSNAQRLECSGSSSCHRATLLNAEESINCSGSSSCQFVNNITTEQLHCSGNEACQSSTINCPSNSMTCNVSCSAVNSCPYLRINCPNNADCNVHCNHDRSCNNARIYCPTGNYPCNIYCTYPLSCADLQITNTNNVNLRCCGDRSSCIGASISPTNTTNCIYISTVGIYIPDEDMYIPADADD